MQSLSASDITDIQLDSADLKYVRAIGLTGCVDWILPTPFRCVNDGSFGITSIIVGPYVNLSDITLIGCDFFDANLSNANLSYTL